MGKPRHLPTSLFLLRGVGEQPNGMVKTLTIDGKHCSSLRVALTRKDEHGTLWSIASFQVDRRLARLLARRILECLEASKCPPPS